MNGDSALSALELRTEEFRRLWQQVRENNQPGVSAEVVFDRLERKYQSAAEAIELEQWTAAAERVRARLAQMRSFSLTIQDLKAHSRGDDPELVQAGVDGAVRDMREFSHLADAKDQKKGL